MNLFKEIYYQARYALPIWLIIILTSWLPDISIFIRLRGFLISFFLPGRPSGLTVGRDVTLLSINRLHLGRDVYIAKGCWLNAIGKIEIEDEVVLAPYVVMSSNNHGFKNGSVKRGGAHPKSIKVGFGTWVASHCVIAAGVVVGRSNLIAANSVVTRNTPDNSVQAGVPSIHVKERIDNPSNINSKHDLNDD